MSLNRNVWSNSLINKPCPSCSSGYLSINDNQLKEETNYSRELNKYNSNYYSSEFISTYLLKCNICNETVAVICKQIENINPDNYSEPIIKTVPKFFYPPLKIIKIPASCPKPVAQELIISFNLFWLDYNSCANKIRTSIEILLNELKVNKTKTKNHKRYYLNLNQRINTLNENDDLVKNSLKAIKFIGNIGSHSSKLTKEDLLDAYELLSYILEEKFSDKKKQIIKISKRYNSKKS